MREVEIKGDLRLIVHISYCLLIMAVTAWRPLDGHVRHAFFAVEKSKFQGRQATLSMTDSEDSDWSADAHVASYVEPIRTRLRALIRWALLREGE